MLVKDLSFNNPIDNIVYDDVLLHLAEHDNAGNVLRFWESEETFIVLGRIGKIAQEVNTEITSSQDIPVLRRSSGGGTVVQGRGCLNYTLVLSKDSDKCLLDLRKSYVYILSRIVEAVGRLGIESEFLPISDIAIKDGLKKFSGNAQKRGRNNILHHGTILYDFPLELIKTHLKQPKDMPEYRDQRSHLDFVTNIDVLREDLKREIALSFQGECLEHQITESEEKILADIKLKRDVVVVG